ncbi:hypothetical protein FVE85_0619 [Porphyridium purpureum]|uniref:Uncharacterized protein n=1 Tax=Porphyridium purpureum TaxID=35688 RepID=A0A5J4Z0U9_PORPP|nr:hypothetical protein FVE85_0619 [Porphyridium purpureum]|eukprot:POR1887..scf208_2
MVLCGGCGTPHDGTYGCGKYCGMACSRRVGGRARWIAAGRQYAECFDMLGPNAKQRRGARGGIPRRPDNKENETSGSAPQNAQSVGTAIVKARRQQRVPDRYVPQSTNASHRRESSDADAAASLLMITKHARGSASPSDSSTGSAPRSRKVCHGDDYSVYRHSFPHATAMGPTYDATDPHIYSRGDQDSARETPSLHEASDQSNEFIGVQKSGLGKTRFDPRVGGSAFARANAGISNANRRSAPRQISAVSTPTGFRDENVARDAHVIARAGAVDEVDPLLVQTGGLCGERLYIFLDDVRMWLSGIALRWDAVTDRHEILFDTNLLMWISLREVPVRFAPLTI